MAVQQQERHRLADDVASSDDDGAAPRNGDAGPFEELDDTRGCTGYEMRAILHEPANVDRMESVNVLVRTDRIEYLAFRVRPHRRGQGRLHQDAVVLLAPIQPI